MKQKKCELRGESLKSIELTMVVHYRIKLKKNLHVTAAQTETGGAPERRPLSAA
jgi:hypothetical protein